MTELRYFTKTGNQYTMKRQYGFGFIVVTGLLLFALTGYFAGLPAMTWIFGIMAIPCLISIYLKHFVVDMDKKEIITKNGLINPVMHIPLSDFQGFELIRTKQYLITTNTSLNMRYLKNGKEGYAIIAQGFTVRPLQNILNEMEEIMFVDF